MYIFLLSNKNFPKKISALHLLSSSDDYFEVSTMQFLKYDVKPHLIATETIVALRFL